MPGSSAVSDVMNNLWEFAETSEQADVFVIIEPPGFVNEHVEIEYLPNDDGFETDKSMFCSEFRSNVL